MAKIVPFENGDIGFHFETLEVEPVPLGHGTTVQIKLGDVNLDDLRLDQQNPRINFKLMSRGISNPSQEELVKLLWEDEDVKNLKRSIQTTGGLVEAVIIQGSDGTVLEGNCRTACLRKLMEEFPEDRRWQKVRARILPAGVDRQSINVLLGELHIAGKNQWRPFEQAAHLYEMSQRGFSQGALAEMYRQSKSSIQAKIKAYELMSEHYLPQAPKESDSILNAWSYFDEFYKKCKPPADANGAEIEQNFVQWMLEGKFKKGEQVRWLPNILENEEARMVLEKEDAEAAWEVVQMNSPELGSKLFKYITNATQALRKAPLEEVEAVKTGDAARLKKLRDLHEALGKFLEQAGKKM